MRKINRLYYNHTLTDREYGAYHLSRARSMTVQQYHNLAQAFALFVSEKYVYREMKDLLEENKQKGISNVLITAQDAVIAAALQKVLGLEDCLASDYCVDDNAFTAMRQPLCFKEGKVHWAGLYLKQNSLSWDQCAFYTDSLNDLPLLEACACPVAVHPGPELASLSRERSWSILKPV
jgi:phosphoserine phosphatase